MGQYRPIRVIDNNTSVMLYFGLALIPLALVPLIFFGGALNEQRPGLTSPGAITAFLMIGYFVAAVIAMVVVPRLRISRLTQRLQGLRAVASNLDPAAVASLSATGAPPAITLSADDTHMSLTRLAFQNRFAYRNAIHTADWTYFEYDYAYMQHSRYGTYEASRVYYSVLSVPLPRALPNIFLDATAARGEQFSYLFDQHQRLRLEGDFDQYFALFAPPGYSIDALSFITPEVMQAMIGAAEYDLEIIDDRLFLYGPLGDPHIAIPAMAQKGLAVKRALMNNIVTYQDDRLPAGQKTQATAVAGQRLKGRRLSVIVIIIAVVYAVILVLGSITK